MKFTKKESSYIIENLKIVHKITNFDLKPYAKCENGRTIKMLAGQLNQSNLFYQNMKN